MDRSTAALLRQYQTKLPPKIYEELKESLPDKISKQRLIFAGADKVKGAIATIGPPF